MPVITRSKSKAYAKRQRIENPLMEDIIVEDDIVDIPPIEEEEIDYSGAFVIDDFEYIDYGFDNGDLFANDLYVGLDEDYEEIVKFEDFDDFEDSTFVISSPNSPTMSDEYWAQFSPPGFCSPVEPLPTRILIPTLIDDEMEMLYAEDYGSTARILSPINNNTHLGLNYTEKYGSDPTGILSPIDGSQLELDYIKEYGADYTGLPSPCSSLSTCEFPTYYSPSSSPENIPHVPFDPIFSGQLFSPCSFNINPQTSPGPFDCIDTNPDIECV